MKIHTNSYRLTLAVAGLASLFGVAAVSGGELAQKARDLMAKNQNSIITVSALNKLDMGGTGLPMSIGGLGEAEETSCSGVVIDASGLTVVSYSALNPMDKISSAFKLRLGGEDSEAIKTKTELSRIQMRLPDGTELAARIVLKDKELDLAFVVPDPKEGEKAPTFTPVKLAGDASVKEQDDVVALMRHGKELGYQPILLVGQVSSLIKKPHTFYDVSVTARPGSAVFLPDGQLLGVTVVFSGSGGGGLFAAAGGMESLVLPASEIARSAEQAKKAAAKKSDDKKETEEKPKAETGK